MPQSPLEQTALKAVEASVRKDWGFAQNVDVAWLLRRWEQFVIEVEQGFNHRLDEYTYELSLRDEIETVVRAVPERLGLDIRECVEPFDHRYRFATEAVAAPLLPEVGADDRYWWSRVPKILRGQLLSDLKDEGIV